MKKKVIFLILIVFFIYFTGYKVKGEDSEEEKAKEAGFVDTGTITGQIVSISADGRTVKVNTGKKDGLSPDKSKGRTFTVKRQGVPVALVEITDTGQEESLMKISEILENITLQCGDTVTSELASLYRADLKIIDNPWCELVSKTLIGGQGKEARWHLKPLYIDVTGDSYLFTCYGNPRFGNVGTATPGWFFSGSDYSFLYLFDSKGNKKWGFYAGLCIFKDFDMSYMPFDWSIKLSEEEDPDYTIYGDKLYLNGYSIRAHTWLPKIIKADGIYFALDLKTGKELWRLKSPDAPAFYGINYDNFINKKAYFYATDSGLYAIDLVNGNFIWQFKMDGNGVNMPVFSQEDNSLYSYDESGYFYKINAEDGKELWHIKLENKIVRIELLKNEKASFIYLFDEKNTICAIDAEGSLLWTHKGKKPFTSPEVNQIADNLIYSFEESSLVIMDSSTGKELWRTDIDKPVPACFSDNMCYCISSDRNLLSVSMTEKKIKWSYRTEDKITEVLNIKNALYILDKNNIYAISNDAGQELWRKNAFPSPVYLEEYKTSADPYSIAHLGKIKEEKDAIFIRGQEGFLTVNPETNRIMSEKNFNDDFFVATGDDRKIYIVSKKHIWALDKTSGKILWERGFTENINFFVSPEDGKVYYAHEDYSNIQRTINSRSKLLLGLISGEYVYFLNKETGEIVNQGKEEESIYPCLEIEGMNIAGEKLEGLYFYCYKDSLYTFRSKNSVK